MKVKSIYKEYMTPKNLQEHMLRVAALAEILIEHWKEDKIDKKAIVQACIFHDIAKPMNFDLAKQAQFGTPQADIARLAELQKRLKNEYGDDEHQATGKICQEIGLGPASVKIVNNLEWENIPRLLETHDFESLIPIYCDMRIGPKGILLLQERLDELKDRTGAEDYEENVKNGNSLEGLISKNVTIDVNSITNGQLNDSFTRLLETEI